MGWSCPARFVRTRATKSRKSVESSGTPWSGHARYWIWVSSLCCSLWTCTHREDKEENNRLFYSSRIEGCLSERLLYYEKQPYGMNHFQISRSEPKTDNRISCGRSRSVFHCMQPVCVILILKHVMRFYAFDSVSSSLHHFVLHKATCHYLATRWFFLLLHIKMSHWRNYYKIFRKDNSNSLLFHQRGKRSRFRET